MTQDEIRAHYGMYPSKSRSHNHNIGRLMLSWQWGEDCWDSLTPKNECYTDYLRLSRVRNLAGLRAWQLIFGRLIVTWAVVPK